MPELQVVLSDEQLEQLAAKVAARVSPRADGWLNAEQAAEYLACKRSHIHDLVQSGRLQHVREGRRILTTREWCDQLLAGGGRRAA